jgi:hypothetical protein
VEPALERAKGRLPTGQRATTNSESSSTHPTRCTEPRLASHGGTGEGTAGRDPPTWLCVTAAATLPQNRGSARVRRKAHMSTALHCTWAPGPTESGKSSHPQRSPRRPYQATVMTPAAPSAQPTCTKHKKTHRRDGRETMQGRRTPVCRCAHTAAARAHTQEKTGAFPLTPSPSPPTRCTRRRPHRLNPNLTAGQLRPPAKL